MSATPFSTMGGTQWDTVVWGSLLAFRGGCPAPFSPRPPSSTPSLGPLDWVVQSGTDRRSQPLSWLLSVSGETIWMETFNADPAGWVCLFLASPR